MSWEPKFLNSLLPQSQTQGSRHRLGVHTPSRWNFTLQSWSSGQVRDGCSLQPNGPSSPRPHADKPNAGIHWKHVLKSALHLSSSDVGLAAVALPFSPHPHLPPNNTWICMCSSKACIFIFPATQPSALEVNIIKYTLILKYSVSILVSIKSAFFKCKKSELTQVPGWG